MHFYVFGFEFYLYNGRGRLKFEIMAVQKFGVKKGRISNSAKKRRTTIYFKKSG